MFLLCAVYVGARFKSSPTARRRQLVQERGHDERVDEERAGRKGALVGIVDVHFGRRGCFCCPRRRERVCGDIEGSTVMPAEAKSKGGGIWKFGCKGGVDVVVALVVIITRDICRYYCICCCLLPVRCFSAAALSLLPFLFIFL